MGRWAGKHAFDRAKERYGVSPTQGDFRKMVHEILAALCGDADAKAWFVRRDAFRETWDVIIEERTVRVVYEPESNSIVSVLPPPDKSP